jgi:protein-disulfide isomerase
MQKAKFRLHIAIPIAALLVCSAALATRADQCSGPDSQKRAEITNYVMKRYHVNAVSDLTLLESARVNDSCFWKMRFAIASPRREVSLFLSPDGRYLSPELFDLQTDPAVQEQAEAAGAMKLLMAGDPPSIGPKDARVTIVMFEDFECPYCKRLAETLQGEVLPNEEGNVRVIFRSFPLSFHPWAKTAAEMAGCVALQQPETFWKLHNFLFENQQKLNVANIHEQVVAFLGSAPDFKSAEFHTCVDKELSLGLMTQDVQLGERNGVHATPTIFVNGVRFEGSKTAGQLRSIIESAGRGELTNAVSVQARAVDTQDSQCALPKRKGEQDAQ